MFCGSVLKPQPGGVFCAPNLNIYLHAYLSVRPVPATKHKQASTLAWVPSAREPDQSARNRERFPVLGIVMRSAFALKDGFMSSNLRSLAVYAVLATGILLASASGMRAQEPRKTISSPAPPYPALARQFQLSGTVRLQLVISASGEVKDVRVLGGNALLADSAVRTVKEWKFAPAKSETTEAVEFKFHP